MKYSANWVIAMVAFGVVLCPCYSLAEIEPSAYIERWATGTLTTGEPFESWRIHVVVPEGDDWLASGIDGWTNGGATWYYNYVAGVVPDPGLYGTYPDAEFATYLTTPHFYPNSEELNLDGVTMTADWVEDPTYVHLSTWFDQWEDMEGDYVIFQATVLDPIPGVYANIDFMYGTQLEPYPHYASFLLPEPASAALLALGLAAVLRRR